MRFEVYLDRGIRQMVAHIEVGDLLAPIELTQLRVEPIPLRDPIVYDGRATVQLIDRAERNMVVTWCAFDRVDGPDGAVRLRPLMSGEALEVGKGDSYEVTVLGTPR